MSALQEVYNEIARVKIAEMRTKYADFEELRPRIHELSQRDPLEGDVCDILERLYRQAKYEAVYKRFVESYKTASASWGAAAFRRDESRLRWGLLRLPLPVAWRVVRRRLVETLLSGLGLLSDRLEYSHRCLRAYYRDVYVHPQIQARQSVEAGPAQTSASASGGRYIIRSVQPTYEEFLAGLPKAGRGLPKCSTRKRRRCRARRRTHSR